MPINSFSDVTEKTNEDIFTADWVNDLRTAGIKADAAIADGDAKKIQGRDIATPDASSMLDVQSTERGSRPFPRMSEAQRDAISSPAVGLIIYNTDTNTLNVYDGTKWGQISGSGSGGSSGRNYFEDPNTEDISKYTSSDPTNLAISIDTSTPFYGSSNLLISKAAADVEGETVHFDTITLDGPVKNGEVLYPKIRYLTDSSYTGNIGLYYQLVKNGVAGDEIALTGRDSLGNRTNILPKDTSMRGMFHADISFVDQDVDAIRFLFRVEDDDATATELRVTEILIGNAAPFYGPREWYEEIDCTGSGDFTAGTLAVSRVGNIVTIDAKSQITFSSSSAAASADGLLPAWARPSSEKANEYTMGSTILYRVMVKETGSVTVSFRDYAGVAANAVASTTHLSISYTVDDGQDSNILTPTQMDFRSAIASYTHTSTQSIPNNTFTRIDYNTKIKDPYNAVTTGSSWNYEAKASSRIMVGAGIGFNNAAGWESRESVRLGLYVNDVFVKYLNTVMIQTNDSSADGNFDLWVHGSAVVDVEKGDEVSIWVFQDSDSTLNTLAMASFSYVDITPIPDLTVVGAAGERNRMQTKFLSADVTTTGDVSDLSFNNLIPGKPYRVSGVLRFFDTSSNQTDIYAYVQFSNGGVISRIAQRYQGSTLDVDTAIIQWPIALEFVANSPTLTFTVNTLTNVNMEGNGTASETFLTLTELNNTIEVSDFT